MRGEIWTQAGGSDYAGKPRPVLIVQTDLLTGMESIITCPFTSFDGIEVLTRPRFDPTGENGLRKPCELMTEKIIAVPRSKLGRKVGVVTSDDMERVEQALLLVLGFEG
jgi:mRNA interferase MazF